MSEDTDQQAQKPDDTPEYLKFIGLLVIVLVALLALAVLSPRLIGQVTPVVLGLGDAPAAQPLDTVEGVPAQEGAPVTEPILPSGPESAAAPEQIAPEAGLGGLETEVQGLQHEVLAGQTLYQVAELYGVSVEQIAAANNLVNPRQLQAGTILIIPQP